MNNNVIRFSAAIAAGSLLFAGCTNIKDDTQRTKTEGTIAGVAAGALLGGLIGAATGGGGRSIATGAVAGGAVGGLAGHKYGTEVAKKKQGYAANEARLRQLIGEARSERQSAERYNASLRSAISQQRTQLARIRSGQADRAAAAKLRRNIDGNLSQSKAQYDRNNAVTSEVKATLDQAPASQDKKQLQAEYASLQEEKALLNQQIKEMNGIKSQLANSSN
ncbi:MAG: hypothetical protein ABI680_00880 [Chthoniobacteraceae bacterium]